MAKVKVGDTVIMNKPKYLRGKKAVVLEVGWGRMTAGPAYNFGAALLIGEKNTTKTGYQYRYPCTYFHRANKNGIGGFGDWMREVVEK